MKAKPSRLPLTNEELKRLRSSDFAKIKLTDEEISRLKAINDEKMQKIAANKARVIAEGKPIVAELHKVGWNVESVWDLVNTSEPYPEAVPILLKHLALPYSDRTREGIARALAVRDPKVREAWPFLVEQYRKAEEGWGVVWPEDTNLYRLGAKDGLAVALAVTVTEERLPELIALIRDPMQGESRLLLLHALRKSKNPLAQQVVAELRYDPVFAKEIASWRSLRDKTHSGSKN